VGGGGGGTQFGGGLGQAPAVVKPWSTVRGMGIQVVWRLLSDMHAGLMQLPGQHMA
jgi:hypothetical protein